MPWEKQFDVDEVLDKAMQVFWSRGYEATSMSDLVGRTGINRGSLYSTYRDKHALFLATLRMYADTIHFKRLAELEAKHSPREAIRRAFLLFISAASEKEGCRGCFLTNTAMELAPHDHEVGKIIADAQKRTETFFSRLVKKGKAGGEFGKHVIPEEAASGLLASLIGISVLARSRPERELHERIAEEAISRLH
jgi:TetR/AcrR family transcriptional repressor of nem operon